MLDLLVAAHEGRQVCVSSLCYASGVPNSTALRHIEHLDQVGLVERTPDPEDHRRAFIKATPPAVERMTKIVERLQDAALGTGRPAEHRIEAQVAHLPPPIMMEIRTVS
jgi:DNA-binding MarR family transcriptional regulator